jgi:NAD(P)-dependent dehydrogenase (short-subunit alcohol dehydrogenase family)
MSERPVALVTGAARGIGAATALEFARRSCAVALVDQLADELEHVAGQARSMGADVLVLAGDLADLDFCRRAVDDTASHFGRLDVLVNNAAWRKVETMDETDVETWERTLRICLTAPAFLSRFAAEAMARRQRGAIVNVTSIRSTFNDGTASAYVAAKGGLDALTLELAALYGPRGIRVVAVAPGAIDTQLSGDLAASDVMQQVTADCIDHTPLGRLGRPEEVARAICWLASDEASFVSGTTFVVDGGLSHNHYGLALKQQMKPGAFG